MRGDERVQDGTFSYVSMEQRVHRDHPLRAVRRLTGTVLRTLSTEFDALYADSGRPSIAPEYILRALLLQVFYSVCSERLLVEQIDYNLLFRWFVGLGMDDAVWNHAVFSKNRDRQLTSSVAQQFFAEVNKPAKRFMSDEHFTVDGTLIQAWASQKNFRSKDGSCDGDDLCRVSKHIEYGRFVWPKVRSGSIHLTRAQLSMLLEGIDWHGPERTWTPEVAFCVTSVIPQYSQAFCSFIESCLVAYCTHGFGSSARS
jgi:transposase